MARKPAPKPKRAKTPKVSKAAIKAKADAAEITSGMEPDKVTGLKHGRPTKYTPELGKRICEELASGRTLRSVCRDDETMPDERTVRSWAIDPEHPFSPQYSRAREIGYYSMADEITEISDDARNDWMERFGKDGESLGWQLNGDHVQRSRLRVEARKWLLSKALPKLFGDKVALTDPDGGAAKVIVQVATGVPREE